MYNDYYLQSIDNKLDSLISNQNTIISNQNDINDNLQVINTNIYHGFLWVLILLFGILFYHFYSKVFNSVR